MVIGQRREGLVCSTNAAGQHAGGLMLVLQGSTGKHDVQRDRRVDNPFVEHDLIVLNHQEHVKKNSNFVIQKCAALARSEERAMMARSSCGPFRMLRAQMALVAKLLTV